MFPKRKDWDLTYFKCNQLIFIMQASNLVYYWFFCNLCKNIKTSLSMIMLLTIAPVRAKENNAHEILPWTLSKCKKRLPHWNWLLYITSYSCYFFLSHSSIASFCWFIWSLLNPSLLWEESWECLSLVWSPERITTIIQVSILAGPPGKCHHGLSPQNRVCFIHCPLYLLWKFNWHIFTFLSMYL